MPEFGSNPKRGIMERMLALTETDHYENANVNVARVGAHFIALTEVPRFIQFSPHILWK